MGEGVNPQNPLATLLPKCVLSEIGRRCVLTQVEPFEKLAISVVVVR